MAFAEYKLPCPECGGSDPVAKNPPVEGQDEEDTQRHLNVVKNKLSGWHGIVHCELNYKTARYEV